MTIANAQDRFEVTRDGQRYFDEPIYANEHAHSKVRLAVAFAYVRCEWPATDIYARYAAQRAMDMGDFFAIWARPLDVIMDCVRSELRRVELQRRRILLRIERVKLNWIKRPESRNTVS